jgi:glucosamine-6-phosphate deaminase
MNRPEPLKTFQVEQLPINIYQDVDSLGKAAALDAKSIIEEALKNRGEASIILATGNSQLSFLYALRHLEDIEWSKVRVFHMDEYLGIEPTHPASFPLFLEEHFLSHVEVGNFHPVLFFLVDVAPACQVYTELLKKYPADLVAMGWGENGHIAFNDPPYAEFNDPKWVKLIELAEASRKQQVGEGHFSNMDQVPTHAITLTIPALLAPQRILCIVPEVRKANAVRECLEKPVGEERPGSILRTVSNAQLYLDPESSSQLEPTQGTAYGMKNIG